MQTPDPAPVKSLAGLLLLVFVGVLSAPLAAQTPDGPYWNTLALPGPLTAPIRATGSVISVQVPGAVHVWSGVHRSWSIIPVSTAATVLNSFNDMLIVIDGNVVHAFSARTATVSSLPISGSAVVDPGPPFSAWLAVVQDGNQIFGFSSFLGQWVAQTIASTSPVISTGSHVALVDDSVNTYGFSSFYGTWVATATGPGVNLSTKGHEGLAILPNEVRGFSAQMNTWTTQAFTGAQTASVTNQKGYALLTNGSSALFFSGYTGAFISYAGSNPLGAFADRNVAVLLDGNTVACYAAGPSSLQTLGVTLPAIQTTDELALVTDGGVVHAFSGVTGTFAPPLPGTFTTSVFRSVAFAQGSPTSYGYSPVENAWFQAPAVVFSSFTLVRDAVILTHPGGYEAFAARYGVWRSHPAPLGTEGFHGAIFAVTGAGRIDLFDARLARWTTMFTNGTPTVSLFRTVLVAQDGTSAYGYGLFGGAWDLVPIQGTVVQTKASSESGFIETTTHVHVFSGYGTLSNLTRYAEFSRFAVQGSLFRIKQIGPAGSQVYTALSPSLSINSLGTLGTLFVSPSNLVVFPLGTVPASGVLDLSLTIPVDPALNAMTLHMQDLVLPPGGAPWLTNSISPIIF